ncbi:hypothetical protein T069G_00436 [Trichoderma breve]|uniref:Fucose-specific lectin n=1 Tax=Trichoderma breve TaxID=2034170 RepID=A0A9W9EBX7_9HYPO|nr:hypothetical protein T069G_00436 [Trichoderma breve]KAJ4863906.1 hypothetical protein T069G_00436 [Trichoderma breve]
MGRLQDVTRFLLAAGGSASTDGKSTHLFHEVKNSLFMETWTGSELTDRVEVVTGVRSDTSAPLVNLHYKRIFVVDQTHTLKCFTETSKAEDEGDDEDEEEEEDSRWEDEELDDLDIRVHDKSQLAVACGEFTIVVFYQNPDGTIGAIEDDGSLHGWKIAQLPNAEALPGTPMASFQAKDTVYFVYVATDQTFRYLEHSNNEWKDAPFSSAKIDGASAKISLAEDEKAETDPKLLIFCLADKKLSTIKPGSTEAETWGTVEDGVYKPTSDQENNGSPHGSIPNPFHPGHLFIYSSGPPPPPLPPATVPVPFPVPFPVAPFACYEDFGQLSLRDHAVEYQQPPPYEYPYGRFDERYYDSHDEALLRQHAQRPDPRFVSHGILTSGILIIKMVTRRIVTRRTITSEILTNEILTSGVLTTVTLTSLLLRSSRAHGNKIRYRGSHANSRVLFKSPRDSSSSNSSSNNNSSLLHRKPEVNNKFLPRRLSDNRSWFIAHLQLRMQKKKKKMMMTTLLPGLRLEQSPHALLNLIVKRLSNNNNSGHKGNKGNNNDSGLSSNSNVVPSRPLSSRKMTTWRKPPGNVVPRHKASVLAKPAVSPRRTPRLMKMKTHSSKNFGVIVKECFSVIVTMNFYVLIEKNFGVLPKKSIRVLVALLLNIVALSMSLIIPMRPMGMKIIVHPFVVLAPDLTL